MSAEVGLNKYEEVKTVPVVDLVFTSSKRSLIDRVSDASLQFTRNTIGTYVDENGIIQTAAAGEPRYTYDPATGEELGLMVEEDRVNLYETSEDYTPWNKDTDYWSIVGNITTAPDGNITATKCIPNSGIVNQSIYNVTGLTDGVTYTGSIFFKAGELTKVYLRSATQSNSTSVYVDLSNGTIIPINCNGTISPLADGWYRVTMTWTQSGNVASGKSGFGVDSGSGETFDGSNGFYAWGSQLEEGSFPTSYIPTSGSTVTRDPDTVTLTNNNLYNNSEFDIINQPFGVAAGSNTLQLLPSDKPIKRVSVFSPNLTQTRVNQFAEKEDEFWRWRVLGSSFGLPQFTTNGQVTVDWGDGTVETLTTTDHTFSNGGGYHDIGFRLDSGTYFSPNINNDATHKDKVLALGPAPAGMITALPYAFRGCSQLSAVDGTNKVIDVYNSFENCTNLKSFPYVDSSSSRYFNNSWLNCSSLTSFPVIDMSSAIQISRTWQGCTGLKSFPLLELPSAVNFYQSTWQFCSSLTSFPLLNFSSASFLLNTWNGCSGLTSFPLIDTSSVVSFQGAWTNCNSLTSFPPLDTSSGTNFSSTWRNCVNLTTFPLLDISNGTTFEDAWRGCTSLTTFPANFFDSWTGTPAIRCFNSTWFQTSLSSTSVENILNSISVSAASFTPPESGNEITIPVSGNPDITVPAVDLILKGWVPRLNSDLKTDPYSSDFATLDLDFATNLSLTDNISGNNLVTFSRNSIGTYVDSNGVIQTAAIDTARFDHDPDTLESLGLLVEESRTNLLTYSEQFDDGIWLKENGASVLSNSTVAPNGTFSADTIVESTSTTRPRLRTQATGVVNGSTYTFSFYVKSAGRNFLQVILLNNTTTSVINISTGQYVSGSTNVNVSPAGNGWFRVSIWGTFSQASGTYRSDIFLQSTSSTSDYTGDGTSGIYVWGAQLEAGSFPTSYIPTPATFTSRASTATYYDANGIIQTAGVDVARDDAYLPDENGTFYPAGLLVESAGTNLLTYSEQFDISPWQVFGTITANANTAPDGTVTADQVSSGRIERYNISYTSGVTYTFSVFVKGTAGQTVGIGKFVAGVDGDVVLSYTTLNGTWQRLRYTFTSAATASGSRVVISGSGDKSGTATNFLIWGAQLEASPYPTSYIPTAGSTVTRAADVSSSSTVTRAADVVSITGTNFSSWYNQSEGTFQGIGKQTYTTPNQFESLIVGGSYPNRSWSWAIIGSINYWFAGTDGLDSGSFYTNLTPNVPFDFNVIQAQSSTSAAMAADGVIKASGSRSVDLYNISSLTIGSNYDGTIKRLSYWPKKLTDKSIQFLSQ